MTKTLEEALEKVFEERVREFSPELQDLLRQLWREGVKLGLYLEREREEMPGGIFDAPPPPRSPVATDDPRRVPGRLGELKQAKDRLIEKSENLSLEIERCLDYTPTLGLGDVELTKARHRYNVHVAQVDTGLERLVTLVRNFKY